MTQSHAQHTAATLRPDGLETGRPNSSGDVPPTAPGHASSVIGEPGRDGADDAGPHVHAPGQPTDVAVCDVRLPSADLRDVPVDGDHVARLAEVLDACPPVVVHARTLRLIDGRHRLEAALLLGRSSIAARLVDVPEDDLFAERVRANATHGLPLTRAERRRAMRALLEQHPDWSDRRIAQVAGVAHTTVGRARTRCPRGAPHLVDTSVRLGRDGRRHELCHDDARARALAALRRDPHRSARSIAREVGLSPTTVCDLRRSIANDPANMANVGIRTAIGGWLRRLADLLRLGWRALVTGRRNGPG